MSSDQSVERAKLAEQAERYEDMAKVRTWVLDGRPFEFSTPRLPGGRYRRPNCK